MENWWLCWDQSRLGQDDAAAHHRGLESPDADDSVAWRRVHPSTRIEARIGLSFRHYALFRHMTIFENVAFGLRVQSRKISRHVGEIRERVTELCASCIGFICTDVSRSTSGGQRQRVHWRAHWLSSTKVLLLDEPFSALDPRCAGAARLAARIHDECT